MSTGAAGGAAGGAGAVGAAAAVGSGGDSGGEGGLGYMGAYDAIGEADASTSYLQNYVPNNEVQEASKPQDENKGKDEKSKKDEKPVNVMEDHSDNVALSDEMMDEFKANSDDEGQRPTSIWPPRRT